MITKQTLLEQIRADILTNNICPDLAKTAMNLVMGEGNSNAEIVFIGEAPGKKEDEQGVPFIGAAGKFLDQMLLAAGLDRDEVYITNVVKYRPPNNRDPTSDEKRAFLPYLVRQLDVIQPKIVVTLGRHSMEYFLPGQKISLVHGQPANVVLGDAEVVVVPLYHPAAALYNGGLRATLIDDFMKLITISKSLEKETEQLHGFTKNLDTTK